MLYCIVLYHIVLYRIVSYRIVLYHIVLCCIVSYCIVSYRIVLYHIVLCCIISYCVVTDRWVFQPSAAQQVVDLGDKKEKEGDEKPTIGSFGTKMDAYAKKMLKVGRLGKDLWCFSVSASEPLKSERATIARSDCATKCTWCSVRCSVILYVYNTEVSVLEKREINCKKWFLEKKNVYHMTIMFSPRDHLAP